MVCFYGFQCNSFAVCESLKGFFCDLQTAWRLVLSMKPWSYIWLEFGHFSTIIAIIRACACWALFVVTLTNTVHLIYIYVCVCVYGLAILNDTWIRHVSIYHTHFRKNEILSTFYKCTATWQFCNLKQELNVTYESSSFWMHDDVIKWKHFPRYLPFVRGIHRSRWIPRPKTSDAELWCFLWSSPE